MYRPFDSLEAGMGKVFSYGSSLFMLASEESCNSFPQPESQDIVCVEKRGKEKKIFFYK